MEELKPSLSPSRVESLPRLVSTAAELRPPPFLPPSSLAVSVAAGDSVVAVKVTVRAATTLFLVSFCAVGILR
ncbi:hypothetical protein AHAS_Ahas19G0252100 [Arachis hypogaea]